MSKLQIVQKGESLMEKVTTSIEEITGAKAMAMLQKNSHNRPMSDVITKRYADMMRKDKWDFNGEAIIIADDGTLLDGQHRLQAILDSGVILQMVVVRGVKRSNFKTVDIGRKRTGADAIATFSGELSKNRNIIAAAIVTVLAFGKNGVWDDNSRNRPTHEDIINYIEKNKGLLRSVDFVCGLSGARKFAPLSALAALHYLFSKKDPDAAEKFFHKLSTGENLSKNDPVLLLRSRLIHMKHFGGIFRAREVVPYIVKAWELVREGRELSRLMINSDYIPIIK